MISIINNIKPVKTAKKAFIFAVLQYGNIAEYTIFL